VAERDLKRGFYVQDSPPIWIPVEKGTPHPLNKVWLARDDGSMELGHYHNGWWFGEKGGEVQPGSVTHWQRLPYHPSHIVSPTNSTDHHGV